MSAQLYHTELGLPEQLLRPITGRTVSLEYTHHAKRAALDDRFAGALKMPTSFTIDRDSIFEVEVTGSKVTKLCVRLTKGFTAEAKQPVDLILVLCAPERGVAIVRTLWFNERNDSHKTLDASKYCLP